MTSVKPKNDLGSEEAAVLGEKAAAPGKEAAVPGGVRRWRAFSLLAVAFLMTVIDLAIVNVALPTIGRDLHFPQSDLQWVVTAYALTFGGFLLLGGRAADLLGRRRLFMAGLVVFTAASLACALATSDTFLIIMRGVQGLGAAIVVPAALSIVMNMFREGAERNKALGIWGGIGAAGATVGVLAGGLLTRYAGWPYIFYLNVPIGVAALLLARRVVPESRLATARRRYDPLGAITVTGALVIGVYAISQAPTVGWATIRTLALLATSAALLAGFLVLETRATAPLLPLRLFRLRTLAGSNAVGFLLGASFFAFIFIGTLYMQQVLGFSALETGLAWLAASVTSVALAGLSQMLVTRTSAKLVMAAGMVLIGAGILWSAQVPVHGHFWADLAGPLFVTGAGTAFAFIPVSIGALAGVAARDAGVASGLMNTSQQIGGAIGVAVASTVAATHSRLLLSQGHTPAAALTGGFQWALWVCGLVGLAAVPVTFLLVRRTELARAVAAARQQKTPAPAPASAAYHQEALQMQRDIGSRLGEAEAHNSLGEVSTHASATHQARDHHIQALTIARDIGVPMQEARALEGIGNSHLQDGNPSEAATYLQQALTIYQRIGAPAAQRVRAALEHHRATPITAEFPPTTASGQGHQPPTPATPSGSQ